MSNKKNQKLQAVGYFRVATKEQLMSDQERKYLTEWTGICQAYCDKVGAELLFVNQGDFGCMMSNGELRHIYADELALILATEQPFTQDDQSGNDMGPTLSI